MILTAGTKWNTDICTFKVIEQPPYEENYCWDMCEGHAESVCLRLAFLYLLYEMNCAQNSSLSIFMYNEDTAYQLKDKYSFHLFISHRPCGFMSDKLSQPLFWKDFVGESPHVLKCSSKLLISSYLGMQGPLSCFLSKPVYLSSIVILDNKDTKMTMKESLPDIGNIENHFKELKHKLKCYKGKVKKMQYVEECIILLQKGDEARKNVDFAEMKKCVNELILNPPGTQNIAVDKNISLEKLLDVVIPQIVLVPTSSTTNQTLFNQNPLLIDDTRKYHTDNSFIALPGINDLLSPCDCSKCGSSQCSCCICGCCTYNCFSCGCPACGCCFTVNLDTKYNIWGNVQKYYLPLRHKPNNVADKLDSFHCAI